MSNEYIDIVFEEGDGTGPGEFVEVEDQDGNSINAGDWNLREDGYLVLRIKR